MRTIDWSDDKFGNFCRMAHHQEPHAKIMLHRERDRSPLFLKLDGKSSGATEDGSFELDRQRHSSSRVPDDRV
jgi:hypothetical protein